MKKILLATTVLVGTAGFAAAEVTTTGSARLGIVNDGTDTLLSSRVRISFTGSGETDGGLSFGASIRADQVGGNGATTITDLGADGAVGGTGVNKDTVTTIGNTGTTNGDSTVFISGGFGKLTFGDVSGAADALVGQVSGVGFTGLGDRNEIGFLGATKTAAYYEYSAGSLTFGAGLGQSNSDDFSVGVKYSVDAFSVAAGYEDIGTDTQVSVLGSATLSGTTIKVRYSDKDSATDSAYALSVGRTVGGANLTAFYTSGFTDLEAMGVGASYDLGGATLAGGYSTIDNGEDTYELGVSFDF